MRSTDIARLLIFFIPRPPRHPAGEKRRAAAGDEWEGHAGKRQDIQRAENVQRQLHEQHAHCRAGGDGIERAAAAACAAHGEKGENQYRGDGAKGDDEPQLLADDGEDEVVLGFGHKQMLLAAVAQPQPCRPAGADGI